jgi:adenosine/AMP kinase
MSAELELITVAIEKPEELNLIFGQAHFIKTAMTFTRLSPAARRTCASGWPSPSRRA